MKKTAFFQSKNRNLPHISRFFSAKPLLWIILGASCGVIASFFVWKHYNTQAILTFQTIPKAISRTDELFLERSYEQWQKIVERKPDYRDGYLMLAWLSKKLGKTEEERTYLHEALSLDPNYSVPEVLQVEK